MQAHFTQGRIMRHIMTMTATSTISIMAIFIVGLVDIIFINMLGANALAAAVGFSGALSFFYFSIVFGLSTAAGVLVSRLLGQDNDQRAKELTTSTIAITVFIMIPLSVLNYIFCPYFLSVLGAEGEVLDFAISYSRILEPFMVMIAISMVASSALRARSFASQAMWVTLLGAVINAILDPIFIFVFDWGLNGAAWASSLSRMTSLIAAIYYLQMRYHGLAPFSFKYCKLDLKPIFAIAIPGILASLATPMGNAFVTRMISSFGANTVAAYAIIGYITPVAFAVIFALSGAVGPIIGQNYGAQQYDRVRETIRDANIFNIIWVLFSSFVLFTFKTPLSDMFNMQGSERELMMLYTTVLSFGFIFTGIQFIANAVFENLGRPSYSTWFNWSRNTLGTIPFIYVGAQWMGAGGVLLGQLVGTVIFSLVALFVASKLSYNIDKFDLEPREVRKRHTWRKLPHFHGAAGKTQL